MSTVTLDLFVLWQRDRFVTSPFNATTPALPAIVAGDTWNISCYFVDDTTPTMQFHRFAGDAVSARIRAAGNNHGYADTAPVQTEIVPSTSAPVVSHAQSGNWPTALGEKQRVLFASSPITGFFKLTFPGPGPGGATHEAVGPVGTTAPISVNATAAEIAAAINALPVGSYFSGSLHIAGWGHYLTVTGTAPDFTINYHALCDNSAPYKTGGFLNLCTVDVSNIQYPFGWSLSLPFTAADFTDYLLPANGPSFFEIMLGGNQAAFKQLTSNPGGGNTPAFTNGPAPNSGSIGSFYDFTYAASGFPAPTFSLTSGALPPGLSLTAAGRLSGTPTGSGTFNGVVTATNSSGAATQAFSIVIGNNPNPGPGGVGRLPSYRDDPNLFHVLDYSDGPYLEDRGDEWPGLKIWHVPFCIDFDDYPATLPAIGAFDASYGYFWKDTPFKFIADGVIEFERLFHNIPGDADRKIGVSKNYQVTDWTIQGGIVKDMAIISFSRDIEANCNYHYAFDDPGALPVVPFIQIIPFLRSQAMWDFGTGFPTGTIGGISGLYTNNYGVSYLPGASIDHICGRLFCRKILTG